MPVTSVVPLAWIFVYAKLEANFCLLERYLFTLTEETDRTGPISKAELHLGPNCRLWAICPVSMETTYQLENQTPQMEEPQGSYPETP